MTHDLTGLTARPAELDGCALGVLATGDADSALFMDLLVAKLEKRHFLTHIVRVSRPSSLQSGSEQVTEQLAAQCDVVIVGVADAVETVDDFALDAVTCERLGVPCAVIVTSAVAAASRHALAEHGIADGRSIVALDLSPESDPASAQTLVDHCYRAVELALTSGESPGGAAAAILPTQRNGEVTCEC